MAKYQRVAAWIKEQIVERKLLPGDRLETELAMSRRFGISRQTVRQALGVLQQEGILERRQGSGTYVLDASRAYPAGQSRRIGVISTFTDDYIFPGILRGMERVLRQHNYTMQPTFTYNRVEQERQALEQFQESNLEGLIIEPTKSALPNPNLPFYQELLARNMPMVFFNSYYPELDIPCVRLDDRKAAEVATRYLIEAGHRRIAGFFQSDDLQGRMRYAGYLDALLAHGIRINAWNTLWFATEDIPRLFTDSTEILRRLADCSAVICYNDRLAVSLLSFLSAEGLRVPEDLSVVSIDNSSHAQNSMPPLTSVNHPKEELGSATAEALLQRMRTPFTEVTTRFPPVLVERESVRRIASQ